MKLNMPIAIAAALVIAALALSMLTSRPLQSAQLTLNQQVERKVEQAQRLLATYDPAGDELSTLVQTATTQPADLFATPEWESNPIHEPFQDRIRAEQNRIQEMGRRLVDLGGEERARPATPGTPQSYQQLQADLQKDADRISQALTIIREAIKLSVDAGDETISGAKHPTATRLEAILIAAKADILGRKAAVHWERASADWARFGRLRDAWQRLDVTIRSAARTDPQTLGAEKAPEPTATAPEPETRPEPEAEPETEPAAPPTVRTSGTGLLGRAVDRFLGGQRPPGAPAQPAPAPSPETKRAAAPAPEHTAPEPEREPPPTLSQRLAALAEKKADTERELAEVNTRIEKLADAIADVQTRLARARQEQQAAEQRMFELDEAGIDPTDPQSLPRFIAEYEEAAAAHSAASAEATVLELGSLRNARPDTDDIEELRTAPLVPADRDRPMQDERGLIPLEADLAAAQSRLETLTDLRNELDEQIKQLTMQQTQLDTRLADLRGARDKLRGQAAQAARAAVATAREAWDLEQQAIDLLSNQGKAAARRAKAAADQRISDARAVETGDTPNPRLELITKGRFISGHAATLDADMDYEQATLLAQRAEGLNRQARWLGEAEAMGIRGAADMAPDAPDAAAVPPWSVDAAAATQAAGEARTQAADAVAAAIDIYDNVARSQLNDLWTLRAYIAAAHYLQANLLQGPPAQNARDEALAELNRSLANRPDSPEARMYRPIMDGLEQAPR